MTQKLTFKAGLIAVAAIAFLGTAAGAGEYTAEFGKTETTLSASATLSDFQLGELAFSEFSLSVDKEKGRDADLEVKAAFTFSEKYDFSVEAAFAGETGTTDFRIAADAKDIVLPVGSLSFGLEATDDAISGNATLAEGAVFGLHNVTIASEFRKDFEGASEFSMDFSDDAGNGFQPTGFASFDTEDPSGFTVGFKVSGKF